MCADADDVVAEDVVTDVSADDVIKEDIDNDVSAVDVEESKEKLKISSLVMSWWVIMTVFFLFANCRNIHGVLPMV